MSAISRTCTSEARSVADIIDLQDAIEPRLLGAKAICALVSVYESHGVADQVPKNALANAMWAAMRMIEETQELIAEHARAASPETTR